MRIGSTGSGTPHVERGRRRVRAWLGGVAVADTRSPLLVWEQPWYPAYYFRRADVRMELLVETEQTLDGPLGTARCFDVRAGSAVVQGGAWSYEDTPVVRARSAIRFDWEAMDHWMEEDEEVFVHPRNPYTRIDVLAASRHVEIEVGGVPVADSARPLLLFETGLPVRYYVPLADVRLELLRESPTLTRCPYKGTATHWSVEVDGQRFDDVAWTYRAPLPEVVRIIGLVAFYDERVDVRLDGEPQRRPVTKFS